MSVFTLLYQYRHSLGCIFSSFSIKHLLLPFDVRKVLSSEGQHQSYECSPLPETVVSFPHNIKKVLIKRTEGGD